MSNRNKKRVLNLLKNRQLTSTELSEKMEGKGKPTTKEIGSWLRAVGMQREVKRGGSSGGSVWGPANNGDY